ncbi:MAG: hypothetical protein J0L93_00660 [Deltaproteobacteria bacterium]|nr:hypothetical protein [Deltaproteobacteria bacterium]
MPLSLLNAAPPVANTTKNRVFQKTEKLMVDPFPNQVAITEKSEDAGISEMRLLIATSKNEEAWFFVHELNVWMQASLGQVQSLDSKDRSLGVYINLEGPKAIFQYANEITFYHFHPIAILRSAKEIKKIYSTDENGRPRTLDKKTLKTLEAWQYLQNHMPSYRDFISLAEILKILKASGIQKKLNAKIATPLGIVEYGLTDEGLQFLEKHDAQQIEALLNNRFTEFQIQKSKAATPLSPTDLRTKASVVQEALESLRGNEFKISFVPHSDIPVEAPPKFTQFAKATVSICKKVLNSFK